uniref:MFS transporter n=1 Tax=Steinernema glaseri TaxID=37863 RepID=A0A1I7Y6C9_9BILA
MQGLMQLCGGSARVFGPLTVGVLYGSSGPQAIWLMEMGVLTLTILSWVLFYGRLVELRMDKSSLLTEGRREISYTEGR